MSILERLELSPLAEWVGTSVWGYPIMLTSHSVGLAIIVGIALVLNLRLLGLIQGLPLSALRGMLKLAWAGFILNLVSGFALFSAQATYFITHPAFLVKIAAIFLAIIDAAFVQGLLRRQAENWDEGVAISAGARGLALLSMLLWLTAIIAGRLIAYI